jgi:hypothetical protein
MTFDGASEVSGQMRESSPAYQHAAANSRRDGRTGLPPRLLAHLEERVGRWSLHDDASARQNISNPDQLMQDALTCSKAFNNLISEIVVCVNSSTKHTKDNTSEGIDTIHNDSNKAMRRTNCELSTIRSDSEPLIADGLQFIEGPMKRPMRVLQKVVIPSYV